MGSSTVSSSGKGYFTSSCPSLRRMKTMSIPMSSGPGRSSALAAIRSSKRSAFICRIFSVASCDSNWNTPAVPPRAIMAYGSGSSSGMSSARA